MANAVLLEARPYRPFKSSEEYLYAMREDLAEWLNTLYPELRINTENFMDRLDTGVALCKHANNVRVAAEEYLARRYARNKSMTKSMTSGLAGPILAMGNIHFLPAAKSGTFFARDNVSNFISWCRKSLQIFECLLFETDDLIMRKNEKHVILCLLEVARRGAKFGMLAPMLVQMERQIDREIAADNKANGGVALGTQTENDLTNSISVGTENLFDTDSDDEDENNEPVLMYGPQPQIITNDLKSLDEMVRDLVEKCTCPSQFPMVRVSEGKYRIGDTKVLIFVRILRSHVMVRVGGGWDTLSHYLDKHDPCRCRAQHRSSVAARLITRTNHQTNGIELHKAQVFYERSPPSARKSIPVTVAAANAASAAAASTTSNGTTSPTASTANAAGNGGTLSPPPAVVRHRSRSPTPQVIAASAPGASATATVKNGTGAALADQHSQANDKNQLTTAVSPQMPRRSMSPSPRRLADIKKKQTSFDTNGATIPNVSQATAAGDGLSQQADGKNNGVVDTNGVGNDGAKFENISDNGSEISDEGYRSLGLIQQAKDQSKRISLHSQTSNEDVKLETAKSNVRLDQTCSDSQTTPSDDLVSKSTDQTLSPDAVDAIMPIEETPVKPFEKAGVYITDDDITVNVSSATGLRKTGFSDNLYTEDGSSKRGFSKIPRSPMARRRSVDSETPTTGLPLMSRKGGSAYRSIRKQSPVATNARTSAPEPVATSTPATKDSNIGTWSGRTLNKKRPSLGNEIFQSSNNNNNHSAKAPSANGKSSFQRNSDVRASYNLYDQNGRRIKSANTSPTKPNSSPLAQQILEAAENAKNDAQMLEKMKRLLSKYTTGKPNKTNGSGATAATAKEYEDFTTAWVNSNGSLDRVSNCCSPPKMHSKRSSAASSIESSHSRGGDSSIASQRRDRGLSRIPAPIRQNTELY